MHRLQGNLTLCFFAFPSSGCICVNVLASCVEEHNRIDWLIDNDWHWIGWWELTNCYDWNTVAVVRFFCAYSPPRAELILISEMQRIYCSAITIAMRHFRTWVCSQLPSCLTPSTIAAFLHHSPVSTKCDPPTISLLHLQIRFILLHYIRSTYTVVATLWHSFIRRFVCIYYYYDFEYLLLWLRVKPTAKFTIFIGDIKCLCVCVCKTAMTIFSICSCSHIISIWMFYYISYCRVRCGCLAVDHHMDEYLQRCSMLEHDKQFCLCIFIWNHLCVCVCSVSKNTIKIPIPMETAIEKMAQKKNFKSQQNVMKIWFLFNVVAGDKRHIKRNKNVWQFK